MKSPSTDHYQLFLNLHKWVYYVISNLVRKPRSPDAHPDVSPSASGSGWMVAFSYTYMYILDCPYTSKGRLEKQFVVTKAIYCIEVSLHMFN